jgi:protein-tyrosine phosphatase
MTSRDNDHMTTATLHPLAHRIFPIEGSPNIRHIGGYQTHHGGVTSADMVRAASLHRLKPEGVEHLRERGVRTVVDLRSKVERERDVTPELAPYGIAHVFAPVFEQEASPVGLASEEFVGYGVVYERMLRMGRAAYLTLFETIAATEGGLLFHCAAGKDRTGVAAALMLNLVGVPDEVIVDDYRHSGDLLKPLLVEWLPRMAERGITQERAHSLMGSPMEAMESALQHLHTTYGSAEGYLRDIGLDDGALSTVRRRIAE